MPEIYLPGSCAITYEQEIGGPVTSQHDYFLTALELHEQCNVLVSLIPWLLQTAIVGFAADPFTVRVKSLLQMQNSSRATCWVVLGALLIVRLPGSRHAYRA